MVLPPLPVRLQVGGELRDDRRLEHPKGRSLRKLRRPGIRGVGVFSSFSRLVWLRFLSLLMVVRPPNSQQGKDPEASNMMVETRLNSEERGRLFEHYRS